VKYRVRIAPPALVDAVAAHEYISLDSPAAADRWFEGLIRAIDTLTLHPRRYPMAREARRFRKEIRQLLYKSHRVLFTIDGDEVRVLYVHHAARRPRKPGS